MKKIMSLMLGLSLLSGVVVFADDAAKSTKTKSTKMKSTATKAKGKKKATTTS